MMPTPKKPNRAELTKRTNSRTDSQSSPRQNGPSVRLRPGTKAARILALLMRPKGVTLKALQTATGWQSHSIRGFLSAIVVRKMGLRSIPLRNPAIDARIPRSPAPSFVKEAAPALPSTQLAHALKTAISAAADAEKFAKTLDYNIRFTTDDIRSMGITVLIGMQQRMPR
jgi:Protein of unknown function (DUF3489)